MSIYGAEITFNVPTDVAYYDFLDAFDAALESLNQESGFYSVDAHTDIEFGALLVGVNVPEDTDVETFFQTKLTEMVLPALRESGISIDTVTFAEHKEFVLA